jgi:ADP-ribose pyrophosphatase
MYPARAVCGKERLPMTRADASLGLPFIRLELLEDLSPDTGEGFLRLVRRKVRAFYPDGTASAPFIYDEVERKRIDASVIAAHYVDGSGERRVFLRSSIRPPVYFRGSRTPCPLPNAPNTPGALWELPAGLVEEDEENPEGLFRGAARELAEEVGFTVAPSRLSALGPSTFPCAGVIAERHFYFEVEVDPKTRTEPSLDGSALEHGGVVIDVPLREALAMCGRGELEDAKSELALRRLRERYP